MSTVIKRCLGKKDEKNNRWIQKELMNSDFRRQTIKIDSSNHSIKSKSLFKLQKHAYVL